MSARAVILVLLVGVVLGSAGGLYYAWGVNPVKYVNADPSTLVREQQDEYVVLVASSYAADRDVARARIRLTTIDADPREPRASGQRVSALVERALKESWDAPRLCALVALAQVLAAQVSARAVAVCPNLPAPTPPAPSPSPPASVTAATTTPVPRPTATVTRRPSATPTAAPTATPSPTPRYQYRVVARQKVCRAEQAGPVLEVIVQDAGEEGLPGVEVRVTWTGGEDHFYTGLKPDLGLGYADFAMTPDVTYAVELPAGPLTGPGSPAVGDLAAFVCSDPAPGVPGVWRVVFEQIGPGLP